MEMTVERPRARLLGGRPTDRDLPPPPRKTGGRCKCLCHTEKAQALLSMGVVLLGSFAFLLGKLDSRLQSRIR